MGEKLELQKRLAADILKCGLTRVRFDQERLDEIAEAITREDIKRLIDDGAIYKIQARGVSRARVREEKKKGLGSRKGGKYSRISRKELWMRKVRAQRNKLKILRDKRFIDRSVYRKIYRMVKAGAFKSIADMMNYLENNKLIRRPII